MNQISPCTASGQTSNRIVYLDILRVFSILATVGIHVIAMTWYVTDISTGTWKIYSIFKSFYIWCVPVFTMISGALFLSANRDISISRLFRHNIAKLLKVYFFWTVIHVLFNSIRGISAEMFLNILFFGDYHLWFVFMIIVMYMLTPVLRPIAADEKLLSYTLILTFIGSLLLPQLRTMMTNLDFLSTLPLITPFVKLLDELTQYFSTEYLFYYLLGTYLAKKEFTPQAKRILYALGILGFLCTIGLTHYHARQTGLASDTFLEYYMVHVAMMGAAIFVAVRDISAKISFTLAADRMIRVLSDCSLGVYMMHVLFLKTVYSIFDLAILPINPLITCILFPPMTFLLCTMCVMVMKRIPILKQFV